MWSREVRERIKRIIIQAIKVGKTLPFVDEEAVAELIVDKDEQANLVQEAINGVRGR